MGQDASRYDQDRKVAADSRYNGQPALLRPIAHPSEEEYNGKGHEGTDCAEGVCLDAGEAEGPGMVRVQGGYVGLGTWVWGAYMIMLGV